MGFFIGVSQAWVQFREIFPICIEKSCILALVKTSILVFVELSKEGLCMAAALRIAEGMHHSRIVSHRWLSCVKL